jgi:hypothetical protein
MPGIISGDVGPRMLKDTICRATDVLAVPAAGFI